MSSLLPINATAQERAIELSISRAAGIDVPLKKLWRPDEIPEKLLPWLAWALSVDFWDAAWPEERKRAAIAAAVALHRIKGTPGAIELLLREGFGLDAEVLEWFDYGGEPYYFRVSINGGEIADTQRIIAAVNTVKNTRSWLDRVISHQTAAVEVLVACGAMGGLECSALAIREIESTAPGTIEPVAGAMGGVEDTALINLEMDLVALCPFYPAGGAVGSVEGLAISS